MSRSIINTATRGDAEKQRIATPRAFIHALEQRFGVPVDFDLAADSGNAKATSFFDLETNALKQDWSNLNATVPVAGILGARTRGQDAKLAFLNPPYAHIKPWALGPRGNAAAGMMACRWLTRWTVMLVPSSHSTDWFLELRGKVQIDAIPRIQFEGATHLYPKDLCLVVAGFGVCGDGYWDWRASYLQWCRERRQAPDPVHLKGLKRFPEADVLPDYAWSPSPFATGAST